MSMQVGSTTVRDHDPYDSPAPGGRGNAVSRGRAYRKEATRLHPRAGRPGVLDGSVGGPLLWPGGEPWPHCDDAPDTDRAPDGPGPRPIVPVPQLFASDAPGCRSRRARTYCSPLWCMPYDHRADCP
ncbi:hypothetical protein [Streptomyces sp. NPDC007883]|uniref:hypothetical protein n=1 Tax=Streptomyces sp. NPDC007883 TaxID=3155116 RepID=UPI0033D2768F